MNINLIEVARFDGKISGQNVRYIRKSLGLSQTKFANLLKYRKGGQAAISEIETNKRKMGLIQIELLYWYSLVVLHNSENNAKT